MAGSPPFRRKRRVLGAVSAPSDLVSQVNEFEFRRFSSPTHAPATQGRWGRKPFDTALLPLLLAAALIGIPLSCRRAPTTRVPSEPLAARLDLSTNIAHVGDSITARLSVYHPPGATLDIPEPNTSKDFIVRDRKWSTHDVAPDKVRTDIRYVVTPFSTGLYQLATGMVRAAVSDGSTLEIPYPAAGIEVTSLIENDHTPPRPIKPPMKWPARIPRRLWILVLVIVLAALGGWLVARLLRGRTRAPRPPKPGPPPHEIALRALRALKEKGWIEAGRIEPFYLELSAITRRYIEDRFGIRAPERTTEEFIRETTENRLLSAEHRGLLIDFLTQSDLVKFARHRPGQADMQAAWDAAEHFVRETRPREETHDV